MLRVLPVKIISRKTQLLGLWVGVFCSLVGVVLLMYSGNRTEDTPVQAIMTEDEPDQSDENHEPLVGELSAVHGKDNEYLLPLPSKYTFKDEWIHPDVYEPLVGMLHHANQDGIKLRVVSAYRSYDHQKRIWENKWQNHADDDLDRAWHILRYSSFPGVSRHHWGTDVDLNSVDLGYWQSKQGKKVHAWLVENAPSYGFCQTYDEGRTHGYENEAWHWSHIATAQSYYDQIRQMSVLMTALDQPIKGATAVKSMPETVMGYVTNISCE